MSFQKNKFTLILVIFFVLRHGYAQNITPYSVPEEFASAYYEVTVNGQSVAVFHAGLNVYFAGFDFTGNAKVSVTARYEKSGYSGETANKNVIKVDETGYWGTDPIVRPVSKNIQLKPGGKTVEMTPIQAGQYSVERSGTSQFKDDVLFLFANRPETSRPRPADPKVIYLKAGIHQQHIDLKSNQTLYIEAGAVLFGSINIWDAKNVRIMGRGTVVYYGPQSELFDFGWKNQKNWHPLTTRNVQGLTVGGITFVGRSRTWSIQMHTTFDAVFDNVKVIAVNPQNMNGDGFDWYGGGRTKITNSLVRSMDDCFAFFTPNSSLDMWAMAKNTDGEVKDILIENCVLWSSLANVYRVGFNGQALRTDNIVMKNSDIIHISKGEWHAPNSVICAVSPNNKGKAFHANFRFEHVRFEEPAALLGLQNEEAQFRNIVFKNITMNGEPVPSLVKSTVANLTFENVILNGKLVTEKAGVPFKLITKEIKNLAFFPGNK
ncbi:MAG: hypothetical protein H7Z13_08225 [Ferruginibacter sp.]|nr:hypothetical protein [Ferruginibacter sp.]